MKLKQLFFITLFFILLISCNKKTIQLPETENSDITEIKDVSAAYLFYDETQKDSLEFNRKNLISTTNWLVNIDKRLTLKQILPHLVYMQNKRNKDGMHKNEDAKNYFTCSNPDIQNLAFIEFTDAVYHEEAFWEYYSKVSDIKQNTKININFLPNGNIELFNYSQNLDLNTTNHINLLNDVKNIVANNDSKVEIITSFSHNLNFQDYIAYKSLLLKLNLNNVIISNDEFIHN